MSQPPLSWEGPIEGYVVNFLTKNHWKIARLMSRDEAMQEAWCIYARCLNKYCDVTEPQHFMALFKTAWSNHFTDMANEDTASRVIGPMPINEEGYEVEPVGETDNDGMLAVMIKEAPREVAMVLALFLNAPQELLDLALGSWRGTQDRRFKSGGSTKINQLLGLPADYDSMQAVVDYFKP